MTPATAATPRHTKVPTWVSPRPTFLVCLLLAANLLAGCVFDDAEELDEAPQGPSDEPTTQAAGKITVTVLGPGQLPLPNATVRLGSEDDSGDSRSGTSNALGLVRFEDLGPGTYVLNVTAEGHLSHEGRFDLAAGATLEHEIVLEAESLPEYVDELRFEGFFDCSATYLIITGDCLLAVRFLLGEAGVPVPLNATNEQFVYSFDVGEGWNSIRITQQWDDPDAALGSTMRVNLEPDEPETEEGHADRYARVQGESPITLEVENGRLHPEASGEDMVIPPEGATLRTRTFHLGLAETQDAGGTGFLGLGIAYQQRFTVDIEVHYGA